METTDRKIEGGSERIIEMQNTYVQSEQQLIEACRIDTNVWDVISLTVKAY